MTANCPVGPGRQLLIDHHVSVLMMRSRRIQSKLHVGALSMQYNVQWVQLLVSLCAFSVWLSNGLDLWCSSSNFV